MTTENRKKLLNVLYTTLIIIAVTTIIDFVKGSFNRSLQAAPIEYVDTKIGEVKEYSDEEDKKLLDEINKKASAEKVDLMYDLVKKQAEKTDKIYDILILTKNK